LESEDEEEEPDFENESEEEAASKVEDGGSTPGIGGGVSPE
jgi:hypothetical protein